MFGINFIRFKFDFIICSYKRNKTLGFKFYIPVTKGKLNFDRSYQQ